MKQVLIAAAVLAFVSLFGCGSDQASEGEQPLNSRQAQQTTNDVSDSASRNKYAIQSGIVYFDVTDLVSEYNEIVYFEDYGRKERIERYNADGALVEVKFSDGEMLYKTSSEDPTVYVADVNDSWGTEMRFDLSEWTADRKEQYKYRDEPIMVIADKSCEAYSLETGAGRTIFAGWSHIILYFKHETQFGDIVRTATRIEEDVPVAATKFMVPEGAEIQKAF